MHDLPEMFGGFLASNADRSHVGKDAWPWRNHETVDTYRQSARRHGWERSEREAAPFDRSKSRRCRRCFEAENRLGIHVDIGCVHGREEWSDHGRCDGTARRPRNLYLVPLAPVCITPSMVSRQVTPICRLIDGGRASTAHA